MHEVVGVSGALGFMPDLGDSVIVRPEGVAADSFPLLANSSSASAFPTEGGSAKASPEYFQDASAADPYSRDGAEEWVDVSATVKGKHRMRRNGKAPPPPPTTQQLAEIRKHNLAALTARGGSRKLISPFQRWCWAAQREIQLQCSIALASTPAAHILQRAQQARDEANASVMELSGNAEAHWVAVIHMTSREIARYVRDQSEVP